MLKRSLITILALTGLISTAYASDTDWSVHLKISVPDSRGADGTVWNHLVAGVQEGATDGFDSVRDTLSLVETDDPVQAMFTHGIMPGDQDNDGMIDNWTCSSPESGYNSYNCSLWRDIRVFGTEKVWSFLVLSPLNGTTVTLEWSFDNKPANVEVTLVDLSDPAHTIDMRNSARDSYTNTFEAGKKYGIRYFEIRIKATGLFILPPNLPDATLGYLYNQKLSAAGGTPVWSLESGELPPGMVIHTSTGEVSGTPTKTGTYQFTVKGTDPVSGQSTSREYTINIYSIPKINIENLPDGLVGTDYAGQITVTGGSAPIVYSIMGNLPEGVTLNSATGVIAGRLIVPGIYDFAAIIKDASGATDTKDFRITVTEPKDENPPEAITLRGIYATETSVLLVWSAPLDDSMTRTAALYDLRYMENCPATGTLTDSTWDLAMEVSGEPRPQAGTIHTYTLTGLKTGMPYCIAMKGMDAAGHLSPISNIVMVPLSANNSASGLVQLASTVVLKKGYNLISLPLIPVPNGRDSVFRLIVGDPVALYRWYSLYPEITPPQYYLEDVVQPGFGYFLYSPADNLRLDVSGIQTTDDIYSVLLQHGWNMVGVPYGKAVLLSDILVKDNITGDQRNFAEAAKSGWIGNTLYYLGEGGYDFASFNDEPPAALEPWVGYWIYVGDENGVEMIFRKP